MKNKILLFDIETAPLVSYTWGIWEQNVIDVKEDWYMLSFSAKWLGEKETKVYGLPDFPLYKKDKTNDKELIRKLWELFDEAEVLVAHNGDEFDIKKANARFITHNLTPPAPYQKIDTKKVAKRYFKFDSNKLDELGEYLGVGRKSPTGGFDLWLGCMAGDKKSWQRMKDYNKQDVVLLEKIYIELRPWMNNHPNLNIINDTLRNCPTCGSDKVHSRGVVPVGRTSTKKRFKCTDCHAWSYGKPQAIEGLMIR